MLIDKYIAGGIGILLALGFGTALSDVGAFVVGKRFGKRKLAPRLSPNKTWAGAMGNLLGAYMGIGVMAFALPGHLRWLLVLLLPVVTALGAIWGGLLESSIKREFAAKDAGSWLLGFGGLLDRVDSLIIVVPLSFYFLRVVGYVFSYPRTESPHAPSSPAHLPLRGRWAGDCLEVRPPIHGDRYASSSNE